MNKVIILLAVSMLGLGAALSSPRFITPDMVKRNGLTDEQYEALWAIGKNPRIDQSAARDWMFRAARGKNVREWLEVIGKTNDFARLVVPTMETNEVLVATNSALRISVEHWKGNAQSWYTRATNEIARADALEYDANILKALRKSAARTQKNLEKVVKTLEKAKAKAETEEEANLYTALIAVIQGIDPNQFVNPQ